MIDNPDKAAKLTKEMKASLPLTARLPPTLKGMMLRQVPGAVLPDRCAVTEIFYTGDEGGITCRLDIGGPDTQNPFLCPLRISSSIGDAPYSVKLRPINGTASKNSRSSTDVDTDA